MSEQKRIVKNTILLLSSTGIGKGLLLLTNILAVRLFGAEVYGIFVFSLAIYMIIQRFTLFGTNYGIIKTISAYSEKGDLTERNSTVSFAIVFVTIVSVITVIIIRIGLVVFRDKIDINYIGPLKTLVFYLVVISILHTLASIFQARHQMLIFTASVNLIPGLMFLTLVVLFYYLTNLSPINVLVMARLSSVFIPLLFLFLWVRKIKIMESLSRKHVPAYKKFIRFVSPLMGSELLIGLDAHLNILVLGIMMGASDVAIFNGALQVAFVCSFILASVSQAFTPTIASLYHKGSIKKLGELYGKITIILLAASIIFLLAIWMLRTFIMGLYGEEFLRGATSLVILASGYSFAALSGPCGRMNTMMGYPQYQLYISIGLIIVKFLLSIWLISIWGIMGAAIATMICSVLSNMLRMILLYRHSGILPFKVRYS
ncbi:MAG: oligosaccharide flippase family protein [Actinomycetia bacterium]|nr:oligosaccharide flippase family protein [Actinomycetes bacterium]